MVRAPLAIAIAGLLLAAPAHAQSVGPPSDWDGSNPFDCELQQAGFGTTVPDPAADPYCVEFDKRRQNITGLGLLDFLAQEPARVAAALPKCFYFQSDHWRGSIVQDDASTVLYEFDGHYFFDKARGDGGVWVTNVSIAGIRIGGPFGIRTHNDIPADPACVSERRASAPRGRRARSRRAAPARESRSGRRARSRRSR